MKLDSIEGYTLTIGGYSSPLKEHRENTVYSSIATCNRSCLLARPPPGGEHTAWPIGHHGRYQAGELPCPLPVHLPLLLLGVWYHCSRHEPAGKVVIKAEPAYFQCATVMAWLVMHGMVGFSNVNCGYVGAVWGLCLPRCP